MFKRVDKVLIGKDINRTCTTLGGASDNLADGEILVVDKNMSILAPGSTIADTDTIYIIQGTGDTYTYTEPYSGTARSPRRFLISDPIEGALVKGFKGVSYDAKGEQSTVLTLTSVPTLAREYIFRFVYKDIKEHPGQFTQTYRYIAKATDVAALAVFTVSVAAVINAHAGRRIDCTSGATTLTFAGRAIPECTTGLTDIDKFSQVRFDFYYNYVDANGNWAKEVSTFSSLATTVADHGAGTWEQVRDLEKAAKSYIGFTNRTTFPVKEPTTFTVKSETYDLLVIDHDKSYRSPDNEYVKSTSLTTVIAVPYTATANQMDSVLAQLNPWMASLPGAFANVSVTSHV
jgi:hypothetical protein